MIVQALIKSLTAYVVGLGYAGYSAERIYLGDADYTRETVTEIVAGMDLATSLDTLPGLSQDPDRVLSSADAVMISAGDKEYRGLEPAWVKRLCGCTHPVIGDGRNVVDPDAWIEAGLACRGSAGVMGMGVV